MAAMQSVFKRLWQTSSGSIYLKSMRWYKGREGACHSGCSKWSLRCSTVTRQKTLVACESARNSVKSQDRTPTGQCCISLSFVLTLFPRPWADCDWIKVNLVQSESPAVWFAYNGSSIEFMWWKYRCLALQSTRRHYRSSSSFKKHAGVFLRYKKTRET